MDLGQPAIALDNGKGKATMYRPRPNLVLVVSEGFLTHDLWKPQEAIYLQAFREAGKCRVFRDAWGVRTIETEYREGQQAFAKAHAKDFADVYYLLHSATVAMALKAGSLFSKVPIKALSDRGAFEAALREALK
jgi:hypothetical protein